MTKGKLLLLCVLMMIGAPEIAAADILCANASGSVFVRNTCLSNEQPLDLASLGLSAGDAYTAWRRDIQLEQAAKTVAELAVDPGSYVIQAYAFVNNNSGAEFNASIICTLASGGAYDFAVLPLQPFYSGTNISAGTLSLTSVADLPYGGNISMRCYNNVDGGGDASINILRVTATRVRSLTRQ